MLPVIDFNNGESNEYTRSDGVHSLVMLSLTAVSGDGQTAIS